MIEGLLIAILVLLIVAVALLMLLMVRRHAPGGDVSARLDALELRLAEQFGATRTDLAERLERVKGDLRQELSDRIGGGFDKVGKAVEGQLAAGREEQAKRLSESITRLEQKFEALTQNTGVALESIRGKVDERLLAISDQVQKKLDQNIKEGFAQFEKVQQHLKAAEEQLKNVGTIGTSITDLNNLLKLPHLRGKFGEASLERLLADFLPVHMYEIQAAATGDTRGRPDAIIKFPDRTLPIDSKFPREQVLPLFESSDPQQLEEARAQLERVIKEQARAITKYINPEAGTTNLALMFLPSETLWYEVVQNRVLADFLAEQRVFPVSPNTLLLALTTVQQTFRWYQMAATFDQAREELGKAQKSFGYFQERFRDVGKGLERAQSAYQTASGHLSRYQSRIAGVTGQPLPEPDEEEARLPVRLPESSETS